MPVAIASGKQYFLRVITVMYLHKFFDDTDTIEQAFFSC